MSASEVDPVAENQAGQEAQEGRHVAPDDHDEPSALGIVTAAVREVVVVSEEVHGDLAAGDVVRVAGLMGSGENGFTVVSASLSLVPPGATGTTSSTFFCGAQPCAWAPCMPSRASAVNAVAIFISLLLLSLLLK